MKGDDLVTTGKLIHEERTTLNTLTATATDPIATRFSKLRLDALNAHAAELLTNYV